jgi:hypothetical protein
VLPAQPAFVFRDPFVETDPRRKVDPYITDGFTSWRIGVDGGVNRIIDSERDEELTPSGRYRTANIRVDGSDFGPSSDSEFLQVVDRDMQSVTTTWTQADATITRRLEVLFPGFYTDKITFKANSKIVVDGIGVWVDQVNGPEKRVQRTTPAKRDGVPFFNTSDEQTLVIDAGETLPVWVYPPIFNPEMPEIKPGQSAKLSIIGAEEDNLAVNSFISHLTAQIVPASELNGQSDHAGLGPFGVTDPRYRGMVFWDTDIWMFPALAILSPDRAKRVSDYRLARIPAAASEFKKWTDKGAPTVRSNEGASLGLLNPILTDRAPTNPLKYPWESDIDGNEASPTETIHQVHITADVSLMLDTAAALRLTEPRRATDVRRRAAAFYAARMNLRDDGKTEIRGVVSPDEFFQGDNDLYTNMIAQRLMRRTTPDWPWDMHLPQDETSFLTYDNDPVRGYKQAAALLTVWPLQDPRAEAQAEVMLDRFSDKTTPNGPAMSGSLHALIRARHGDPNEALQEWRTAWQRCTNRSMLLFSEKPGSDENVFLTGVAGSLNTVLYGFLGLRFDEHEPAEAGWKTELDDGWWLSCSPNLPDEWEAIVLEDVDILGKKYIFRAGHTGVDVSELSK